MHCRQDPISLLRAAFPSCSALPSPPVSLFRYSSLSQRHRVTNTPKRDECVKGTRADQTAPEQRMPSHEPLNKLLSLPTAQSPGRFCAHCSRLAPSGVPTQSSPLLPLDPYTENANSAHFAQLKAPQQHFPQGVALSAPQEANPISQMVSAFTEPCKL